MLWWRLMAFDAGKIAAIHQATAIGTHSNGSQRPLCRLRGDPGMDPDTSRVFSELIDAINGLDPLSAGAHLVSALLVLLIGILLALALRALTRTLLRRTTIARGLGPSMPALLSGAVYVLVLGLAIAASLVVLGVPLAVVFGVVLIV